MLYTFFFSSIEHLAFSIRDLGYISLSFIASVAFWAIFNRANIFFGSQSDNLLLSLSKAVLHLDKLTIIPNIPRDRRNITLLRRSRPQRPTCSTSILYSISRTTNPLHCYHAMFLPDLTCSTKRRSVDFLSSTWDDYSVPFGHSA